MNTPEKKETLDDNARKFTAEPISPQFLDENNASSCSLTIDWLEVDKDSEKKVVHKKFDNDDTQILLIAKVTKNGDRTSEKENITKQRYGELVASSILHLEKKRYEFKYIQKNITFSIKYDEFTKGKLCMLEVDGPTEKERNSFDSSDFPNVLTEVTGDMQYYGYRIATIL